ncbi:MAG: MFS transporter [Chitinophagaceae bacterium]|nr:MAG: MFS transporter [Chitinophagaceae bacterium]
MNQQAKQPTNYSALGTLVTVFFFWGFIAASNSIFIPFCKSHFHLTQFESQLIDTAFYGAYFIGSMLLFVISSSFKIDILNKMGYKNGIIWGLAISIAGALCMVPAVNSGSFYFILGAFFVIALGFSLQQTAAQPFAISLGDPSTGAHRLNLGGSVNSFGTTVGPLIVSIALFGSVKEGASAGADIGSIKTLYLIVAGVFFLAAVIFFVSKLPKTTGDEHIEKSNKALTSLLLMTAALVGIILLGQYTPLGKLELTSIALVAVFLILFFSYSSASKNGNGWGAMKYPQLILGMLAIFVYVGVEVTIASNMGALLKTPDFGGITDAHNSSFISLYWGSLMIGRWTGAISVFNFKKQTRQLLTIVVPVVAFGLILGVNYLRGNDISDLYLYIVCVAIMIAGTYYGQEKPVKTLLIFSVLAAIAMLIGILSHGTIATYAFISGGLFCSVMWPCIFALAVAGLGKYTSEGSAFLIMMILGGAIIPPMQGALADKMNIHTSYILALVCFIYLAWHALKTKNVLKAQGLDFDQQISGGH